jgi:hypothetical protein
MRTKPLLRVDLTLVGTNTDAFLGLLINYLLIDDDGKSNDVEILIS